MSGPLGPSGTDAVVMTGSLSRVAILASACVCFGSRYSPRPRKRTLLGAIGTSAGKGGHHKQLDPHSFSGPEFTDGDDGNQNENGQHDGLRDREQWFSLRRSQRIESRNF